MKNNISYFRHEVDSFNHWKFKTLRKRYGWAGEGQFWALNSIIASSEGCSLDLTSDVKKRAIAAELDMNMEEFAIFIDYLVKDCTLVKDDADFITTGIVQEIYSELSYKRQRDRDRKLKKEENVSDGKRKDSTWKSENSTRKTDFPNGIHAETDDFQVEFEQSKVKERKVKESIELEGGMRETIRSAPPYLKQPDFTAGGKPPTHPPKKPVPNQQEAMLKRLEKFKSDLLPFEGKYGTDMVQKFFLYWSEPNRARTKMKFELKTTFDISRRLITWEGNQAKFERPLVTQQKSAGPQLNILT